MTTRRVARCGIYDTRPQVCRDYPKLEHYRPDECTYYFIDNERLGSCNCDQGACCQIPRQNGEPGGAPIPEIAGGTPCKHLIWTEVAVKEASSPTYPVERQDSVNACLGCDDE